MNAKSGDIREDILSALSTSKIGMTITDTAKKTGYNYMTVSKYLAILEAAGKVRFFQIGMAKLFRKRIST